MKITGFVGSPRKGGNTDVLVRQALSGAEEGGAATRLVYLNDVAFRDCQGCWFCKRAGACRLNDGMEELYEADILLHVIDVSNRSFENHIAAVEKILEEIGISGKKTLRVFNKADRLEDKALLGILCRRFQAVAVSALQPESLGPLLERLEEIISPQDAGR